jgi:hypothetical protein
MTRLGDGRHVIIGVDVAHHTAPRRLHVTSGTPQVGDITNPRTAACGRWVPTVLDGSHGVFTGLGVAVVEALLEVDPRRVLRGPVRAAAVVVLEVI